MIQIKLELKFSDMLEWRVCEKEQNIIIIIILKIVYLFLFFLFIKQYFGKHSLRKKSAIFLKRIKSQSS